MMGLGSVGEGSGDNYASSMSNLSALAPPFTVDRLNLNPMLSSNPVLNYSELSYAVEPFSHTSHFASPSAPRHELDIHPTETTSMPLNDYQISDPMYLGPFGAHWSDSAFVYGGGVKPHYSPSVPPMIGEGSVINEYDRHSSNAISPSGLSVSSQLGYNQSLFDLECGSRWADSVGFSDSLRPKPVGLGGDFSSKDVNIGGSHSYQIQVNQGIYDIPFSQIQEVSGVSCGNLNRVSDSESGVSCGNLNRVSDSEVYHGQLTLGNLGDRPFLEQSADLLPHDCIKQPCISVSSPIFPESYSFGQSFEMHQNVSNFQNLYGPYENYGLPFDPSLPSSVSVMKPSPAVVSRTPPSANDFMGKDVAYYRTTRMDNVAVLDCEQAGPSKEKDNSPIPSYYLKENFLLPASGKELTGLMQSKNNFPIEFKSRVGSQLPDIKFSSGFSRSCDINQVVYSAADSSCFVDHCNPSVDSPCWKGAPLFSEFAIGSKNSMGKNLDQFYGSDHNEHQNLGFLCDSTRTFSKMSGEGNNNDYNRCGRNSFYSLGGTLYGNSLNREHDISDGAKAFVATSTMMTSGGIQISNLPNFQNEPSQPRNSESSLDVKFLDTKHLNVEEDVGLTLNDVSEGGSVAVCAAEKVLASPSSKESGYKCENPLPDTKFDVQTIIKATHNLSELLLYHLSCDACCALEEKNMVVIKSIISNLNACMRSNIDQENKEPKLKKCVQDTSAIIKDSHCVKNKVPKLKKCVQDTSAIIEGSHCADKISDGSSMTNETWNSYVQPNYKQMDERERDESPVFSPLRTGSIKRNDDMTKAIKKILEDNFHGNKEISSQALVFKNLWLEAEANLCSMGYKARFDQMKIEMGRDDVAEMMSKVRFASEPNTDYELTPKTHDGTSSTPALKNSYISSMAENANDVEASIMSRFKILKSRGNNIESINVDNERKLEKGDGEHASSIMERFNILNSREDNLTSTNIGKDQQPERVDCDDHLEPILVRSSVMKPREDCLTLPKKEKEPHPEMVNNEHAESVMARFNILQSREASSRTYIKEERADMVDFEFSGKQNVAAVENAQSEAEVFYLSPKPHQTGSLGEHEFGSTLDGRGYDFPKEHHFSVPNDPMVCSFDDLKMMNQCYSRLHDCSLSSDWEHVKKDDLAWKNL